MLRIGHLLSGFCAGHFGRDSYGEKRVEAIGADWVIVRNDEGRPEFADCDPQELLEFVVNR